MMLKRPQRSFDQTRLLNANSSTERVKKCKAFKSRQRFLTKQFWPNAVHHIHCPAGLETILDCEQQLPINIESLCFVQKPGKGRTKLSKVPFSFL